MKRCIQIAKNGLGSTAPNPMVGCVIVHNGLIIGEGFTSAYGGHHAEVNAINSVQDKSLLKDATLYVTLEPCSHFGKTPPCSDLIIKHKIKKVVIGTLDIHSKVAGKGIEKLITAGCNVSVGILEKACKEHHKRFFTYHHKKRPFIILKWAQSLDGYIAPESKKRKQPVWITNSLSRQLVHKWRTEEQAILVGTNTVKQDNPSLTARDWFGKNPIRVVLDKNEGLSNDYRIFDDQVETIKIVGTDTLSYQIQKDSYPIDWNLKDEIASQICDVLYKREINSVIIEGGRQTLQTFIDEDLWDEARVFIGNVTFYSGTEAPMFNGILTSEVKIKKDILRYYKND